MSKEEKIRLPLDHDIELEMNAHMYFTKLPNLRKYDIGVMAPPKISIKSGQEFETFNYVSPIRKNSFKQNIKRKPPSNLSKIEINKTDSVEVYGLKKPLKIYESVLEFKP